MKRSGPCGRLGRCCAVAAVVLLMLGGCTLPREAYLRPYPVYLQYTDKNGKPIRLMFLVMSLHDAVADEEGMVIFHVPANGKPGADWKRIPVFGTVTYAAAYEERLLVFHHAVQETISVYHPVVRRAGDGTVREVKEFEREEMPWRLQWDVRASATDAQGRLVAFGTVRNTVESGPDEILTAAVFDKATKSWQEVKFPEPVEAVRNKVVAFAGGPAGGRGIYVAVQGRRPNKDAAYPLRIHRFDDGKMSLVSELTDFHKVDFGMVETGGQVLLAGLTSRDGLSKGRSRVTSRSGTWVPPETAGGLARLEWTEHPDVLGSAVHFTVSFFSAGLVTVPGNAGNEEDHAVLFRVAPERIEVFRYRAGAWTRSETPPSVNSRQFEWMVLGGLSLSIFLMLFGGARYRYSRAQVLGLAEEMRLFAPLPHRALAHAIDLLLLSPAWIAAALLLGVSGSDGIDALRLLLAALLVFPLLTAAFGAFCEARWGATAGKWVLGLRVVDIDGGPCTPRAAVLRNLVRLLDGSPFGVLPALFGLMLMVFSRKSQRLGDMIAGTLVVRANPPEVSPSALEMLKREIEERYGKDADTPGGDDGATET